MEFLKKALHDLFHATKPGGWIEDTPDARDYRFEKYFKEEIFGAVLPRVFLRAKSELPKFPFQNSIFSCVSSSFTFVNSFNSKKEGNDVFLSWRYLYALVTHYSGGTTFRDNGNVLKDKGQCLNTLLPEEQYYLGETAMQNSAYITQEANDNARKYKIGGYFYISPTDKAALKTAILAAPIIIGVYCGSNWYSSDIIKWTGEKRFGHAICIVGWNDDRQCWQLADWDGDEYKYLDYDYPITSALTIRDLPDNFNDTTMKIIKLQDDPKIWAVLPNGKIYHILNMQQFNLGEQAGFWKMSELKIVPFNEFNEYEKADNPPAFLA